jgi:hypothetical protein
MVVLNYNHVLNINKKNNVKLVQNHKKLKIIKSLKLDIVHGIMENVEIKHVKI